MPIRATTPQSPDFAVLIAGAARWRSAVVGHRSLAALEGIHATAPRSQTAERLIGQAVWP